MMRVILVASVIACPLFAGCSDNPLPSTEWDVPTDEEAFEYDVRNVSPSLRGAARGLNQEQAWEGRALDCSHFDSWEMAQVFYEMFRETFYEPLHENLSRLRNNPRIEAILNDLDSNENGVACEALR